MITQAVHVCSSLVILICKSDPVHIHLFLFLFLPVLEELCPRKEAVKLILIKLILFLLGWVLTHVNFPWVEDDCHLGQQFLTSLKQSDSEGNELRNSKDAVTLFRLCWSDWLCGKPDCFLNTSDSSFNFTINIIFFFICWPPDTQVRWCSDPKNHVTFFCLSLTSILEFWRQRQGLVALCSVHYSQQWALCMPPYKKSEKHPELWNGWVPVPPVHYCPTYSLLPTIPLLLCPPPPTLSTIVSVFYFVNSLEQEYFLSDEDGGGGDEGGAVNAGGWMGMSSLPHSASQGDSYHYCLLQSKQ